MKTVSFMKSAALAAVAAALAIGAGGCAEGADVTVTEAAVEATEAAVDWASTVKGSPSDNWVEMAEILAVLREEYPDGAGADEAVQADLDERGLGGNGVVYEVDDGGISYATYYESADEVWRITCVDGSVSAFPLMHNMDAGTYMTDVTDAGNEYHFILLPLYVSESESVNFYDGETGEFTVVDAESAEKLALDVDVVDRIDARTLDAWAEE